MKEYAIYKGFQLVIIYAENDKKAQEKARKENASVLYKILPQDRCGDFLFREMKY